MDKTNAELLRDNFDEFDGLVDRLMNICSNYKYGLLTMKETATEAVDASNRLLQAAYDCRITELCIALETARRDG